MKISPEALSRISKPGSVDSGELYWTPERVAEVRRLRDIEKKSLSEIGEIYRVSGERIRQVLKKEVKQ